MNSRYKSLSLKIGKEFYVLSLRSNEILFFFKISTYISIYLLRIIHFGSLSLVVAEFKGLFSRMKELFAVVIIGVVYSYKSLWIKLGRSSIMTFSS